ncbi:MAG TPA: glycosyltransferase family 39 protein [Tepidisphaeraceae bacterium]
MRTSDSRLAGTLPRLSDPEHWSARLAMGAILFALLTGFGAFTQQFWVPAHAGTDQNGYLVGGRMIANFGSAGFKPEDPYTFVGRMWIAAPDGRYFPKYPLGLPVLVAVVFKAVGPTAVYFISPICMILALLAVFLTVRLVAGSFAGLLGTAIVATSPVTLGLTNNPNSHAATLCFVAWGMYLLLGWWQRPTFWRAALAGLFLGCAATIRYSEALLGLPLLAVLLFNLHWRRGRSWAQVATLLGCWMMPILVLLTANRISIGTWTGYDATNESTGFDARYFARNWEPMVRQLAGTALFFTLPLSLLGLIQLFARNWKLALVLWAWILPGVLLYTSYYWAPDNLGIGYMRFLLSVFPPLALGAAWCLTRLAFVAAAPPWTLRWLVGPLAALVLVLGAGAYNVWAALPTLENDRHRSLAVAEAAEKVMTQANVPAGSVLFGPREMLHHLQFVANDRLYSTEEFDRRYIRSLERVDPDEPSALQPERAAALYRLLKDKSDRDLAGLLRELTAKALNEHRRVFAIVPDSDGLPLSFADSRFEPGDGRAFAKREVLTWTEPEMSLVGVRGRRGGGPGGAWRAPVRERTSPGVSWRLVEITSDQRSGGPE